VPGRLGARAAHHLPEHVQKLLFGTAMCALGPAIAAKPLLQRAARSEVDAVAAAARRLLAGQ
jgi:hypothetical protein